MPEPLGLRLRTRLHEPAHGALVRLAGRMGARAPRRLGNRLGVPMKELACGRLLDRFAALAGVDHAELAKASPTLVNPGRLVEVSGEMVRLGDWSTRARRRCPLCLAGDVEEAKAEGVDPSAWASHRFWWDLRSIGTCHVHGSTVTDRCPHCSRMQRWTDPSLLRCACGASLTVATPMSPIDPAASAYIAGRLGVAVPSTIPVVDGLPLHLAIRALEQLGAAAGRKALVKPRTMAAVRRREREVGLEVAAGWPHSMNAILDGLLDDPSADGSIGLIRAYGWVYSEIAAEPTDAFEEKVAAVLREHAVRATVMSDAEPRLGASPPITVSATQAARSLGRSYATTRRLLDRAGAVPAGSRRGVAFTLAPEDVAALGAPHRYSKSAVAAVLRVGTVQGRELADLIVRGGDPANAEGARRWLSQLRARAVEDGRTAEGLSPLPIACRNMSVPLHLACVSIAAGEIKATVRGPMGSGVAGLLIRDADLVRLRAPSGRLSAEAIAREHRSIPRPHVRSWPPASSATSTIEVECVRPMSLLSSSRTFLPRPWPASAAPPRRPSFGAWRWSGWRLPSIRLGSAKPSSPAAPCPR